MKRVKDYYYDPWGYRQPAQQQSVYGGTAAGGYDKWGFGGTYVNGYSRGYANGSAAMMQVGKKTLLLQH